MTQDSLFTQLISDLAKNAETFIDGAQKNSQNFFNSLGPIIDFTAPTSPKDVSTTESVSSIPNNSAPNLQKTEPDSSTTERNFLRLVLPKDNSSSRSPTQKSSPITSPAPSSGNSTPLSTQGSSSSGLSQKSSSGISKQASSSGSSTSLPRQVSSSSISSQQSSSSPSQASSSGSSSKTMESTKSSEDSRRSYMPRMPNLGILKALSMTKTYLSNGLSYMYENSPTLWNSKDAERSSPTTPPPKINRDSTENSNQEPKPSFYQSIRQRLSGVLSGKTALNYQGSASYKGKVFVEVEGSTTLPQTTANVSDFLSKTASGIQSGARKAGRAMGEAVSAVNSEDIIAAGSGLKRTMSRSASSVGRGIAGVVSSARETASSVNTNDMRDAAGDLGRTMSRSASSVGRGIAGVVSSARDKASSLSSDNIRAAGSGLGRTMSRSASSVGRGIASAAGSARDAASSIDFSGVRDRIPSPTIAVRGVRQMANSINISGRAWFN